ncbi:MAG: serine/threonine-protein kinase [Pseudomonadota bacterium]
MTKFPEPPTDDYGVIYLEHTDAPLPEKLNPSTRYMHFKTIARGGKAIIQSCLDRHLGRVVCYKKLKPEFRKDKVEQQRFLREARVGSMLQHPSTIPMYELGRDNRGDMYFTMKLVHGYTLREVLDYRERYDLTQLLNILIQVLQALAYAHTHRVVHRDIKPENILVGPYGEVLLLDWGLAKVWPENADADERGNESGNDNTVKSSEPDSNITGQGNLEGTVTYMSPEQLRRDPAIDYRSDIFSMGVILYEVLCGRTPAVTETVREMIDAVQNEIPLVPSAHTGVRIPEYLDTLAIQCIAKAPDDRVQDCGELIRLLQEEW